MQDQFVALVLLISYHTLFPSTPNCSTLQILLLPLSHPFAYHTASIDSDWTMSSRLSEYQYEFSNQIRVPPIITYHTNLIPNVYLSVSQQQRRVIVWGIQLCRNSKVVLVLELVLVVKSEGR